MTTAFDPAALKKALEVLDANKLIKANTARHRYENRELRLLRRKAELEAKRHAEEAEKKRIEEEKEAERLRI